MRFLQVGEAGPRRLQIGVGHPSIGFPMTACLSRVCQRPSGAKCMIVHDSACSQLRTVHPNQGSQALHL